ncbi:MAG: anti-phage-associated DUF1156 domain-containing protein [Clostridiaceae bacterium]
MSNHKSFIEVQFPVSKISKESYKERKAGSGQTLTGLGKWWGRKPLILVRATLLGLLMPASDNPNKDREIFLKILMMDELSLSRRKNKSISARDIYDYLTVNERKSYFGEKSQNGKIEYKKGITRDEKQELQGLVFKRMPYDKKLKYCIRPEEISNIEVSDWEVINKYLGTKSHSFQELFRELGLKKYGRIPVVGDCFSGGGSIAFEAARMGCNVYASDLNPISMLLTLAALKIVGSNKEGNQRLREFQDNVFNAVNSKINEYGIEKNEDGWRANAYLYCYETLCPECNYKVPILPSFVIGEKSRTVVKLEEISPKKSFNIHIEQGVESHEVEVAKKEGTIKNYKLCCPHCHVETPIPAIRKDKDDGVQRPFRYNTPNSLRKWGKFDITSNEEDIFTERLYCIRYEEEYIGKSGKIEIIRHYVEPAKSDIDREEKVINILNQKLETWIEKGYIPDSKIERGWNTNQLTYEKGWTYWRNLFNPRQLLIDGMLFETVDEYAENIEEYIIGLIAINKCCNWNSKLSIWHTDDTHNSEQLFYNQAFNTLFNYCCRAFIPLREIWNINYKEQDIDSDSIIKLKDAREVDDIAQIWITDPPYADAVHYHELSEFFLAWNRKFLLKMFPDWYSDSKRVLAVKGTGESFNGSMVEIYKKLANCMPDNGQQIVMFTHQDVSVWADLTMILWASGLRVTAAWNIATETESGGLKEGNYVKGTVLLVLRKQSSEETAYLDELYPEIEEEVKHQIDSMRDLDDKEDPNFTDADYLLAAYAASLKVLTSYKKIEDIDVKYEISKQRVAGEESPIERIINEAVKIAYDYLIPSGFDQFTWKLLISEERFYIKGLDLEKDGVYKIGAYQELARGFGVREYKDLLESAKANEARLMTALEFGMRGLGDNDRFGSSVLRNVLVALHQSVKEEDTAKGRNWLRNELPNYWQQRNTIIEILDYIATLGNIENMDHWKQEANYAKLLRELIKNDGV